VARLLPLSAERAGAKGPTLGTPFPLPLRCIYPSSSSQSNALSRGSGQSQQQIETHFAGKGYGELKRIVADLIIMTLGPIQERYYALMDDQTALDALSTGARSGDAAYRQGAGRFMGASMSRGSAPRLVAVVPGAQRELTQCYA